MQLVSDFSKVRKRKFSINKILRVINALVLVFIAFSMIYPFWEILVKSLMSDREIIDSTSFFWPKDIQLEGYKIIFTDKTYNFGRAFLNSVFVTVVGTIYQLIITTLAAYALSKKDLKGRRILNFFFIFTMYFGGGLIPYYLVIKELNLLNTIWVLIIPQFISVYNVLVMRSFFQSFPHELIEAAKIDGASDLQVFTRIVLPLSKAILATIALFIAVGLWNNWFNSMLYLQKTPEYRPMAYVLKVIIDKASMNKGSTGSGQFEMIGESVQYAAIIVSTLPILVVYPFLQKHFTKGVMIGSIKG